MSNKPTLRNKGRYNLNYRGTKCANCNHPLDLSDKYCPNCAQANSTKKLSIKDFFDEFFSSMISYDSKLLKTLVALLWRPGKITKDYINGKRASYTNPFRFLLSLAIIYFLIINSTNNFSEIDKFVAKNTKESVIKSGLSYSDADEVPKKTISNALLEIENASKYQDSVILQNPKKHLSTLENKPFLSRFVEKVSFFNTLTSKDKFTSREKLFSKLALPNTYENRKAYNVSQSFLKTKNNPGGFVSALISKLPFATFFFLPVFAIFIWLVYIRKKHTYTDHIIFSFHNQSLFFILLIISFLVDSIFNISSNGIFVLIFSIYLFLSMRRFYQQGSVKTMIKFVFLNTIFFILAISAVGIVLTGSLFTY